MTEACRRGRRGSVGPVLPHGMWWAGSRPGPDRLPWMGVEAETDLGGSDADDDAQGDTADTMHGMLPAEGLVAHACSAACGRGLKGWCCCWCQGLMHGTAPRDREHGKAQDDDRASSCSCSRGTGLWQARGAERETPMGVCRFGMQRSAPRRCRVGTWRVLALDDLEAVAQDG